MPTVLDQPAAKQLRATIAQEAFDFVVPGRENGKEWFSVPEAAKIIGAFSERFVKDLIDAGRLDAHGHNAANELYKRHKIHRTCLVAYLLKTATYEPADYVARLCELIDRLPPTAATVVAEHAVKHRNKVLSR